MSRANNAFSTRAVPTAPVKITSACIDVVDPVARAVLAVPECHLLPTRGLEEYRAAPGTRDISLCCLFQKGRCRAQQSCRQVHADRNFVTALRAAQTDRARCCGHCSSSSEPACPVKLTGRATADMPALPSNRIVPTYGCRKPSDATTVDWSNVCRLQLQDSCKYGESCRNVHICAKLGKMLLARAATNVNAVVPDSVRDAAAALDAALGPVVAMTEGKGEERPRALGIVSRVEALQEEEVVEEEEAPAAAGKPAPKLRQMPMALRAKFPSLDETSLTLRDGDLDGLVFNLPTLASASDAGTDRFDIFSPSPARQVTVCSPSMCSPNFA